VGLAELRLVVTEQRARAQNARELADRLLDQEERREILRYADDLERNAARLDAEIAGQKTAPYAIDVI
jgi:hypothetical protein